VARQLAVEAGDPETVQFSPSAGEHFGPSGRRRPDSAKTDGKPLRRTVRRKSFLKRDVPDSTSFWNSNVTILTSWAYTAPFKAVHSGKWVV
jgi:hypothetical protein